MRRKFHQEFEGNLYNESEYNLEVFARWLGRKLDKIYIPIVVIIESEERNKFKKEPKG